MENVRQSILENIRKLELPNKNKAIYKRYGKPPYSYAGMIIVAIMTSPNKMLSLSQIHEYLRNMFDFFQQPYMGWKDSVRHNLSHCKCFVKGGKTPDGRYNLWAVNISEVTPSLFRRQQTVIAKDGNYAEDLHDELQIPRTNIPFFNYSRGAPSTSTSDRTSSDLPTNTSASDKDVHSVVESREDQAILSTKRHAFTLDGPPTPVLYRLPSGNSANSPIVVNSPDKGTTTVIRPLSVLSTTSSAALRSLSEQSRQDQCPSPAFSDITEPMTPDDMGGFRPINEDPKSGWITPIGQVRDGSDLTRGATCLSDVSPSRSECSASGRVPKRKQIRHRPRVRKFMRTDATPTGRTEQTFSHKTYADLQSLVTQSSSDQWELSIHKAVGNLQGLCQTNTDDHSHVPSFDTTQAPEDLCSGEDVQTTFCVNTDGRTYYIKTESISDRSSTPSHPDDISGFVQKDHTYSSPERCSTPYLQSSDAMTDGPPVTGHKNSGSLEEFANCALWYSMLS